MHLIANAETIDRLVEQGVDFAKAFHAEFEKDPTGPETQFLRGEFSFMLGFIFLLGPCNARCCGASAATFVISCPFEV